MKMEWSILKTNTTNMKFFCSTFLLVLFMTVLFAQPELVPFKKGDKWGYVNKSKEVIIPVGYDVAEPFQQGLAKVAVNGKFGMIRKDGTTFLPIEFDQLLFIMDGLIMVQLHGRQGLLNLEKDTLLEMRYSNISYSASGVSRAPYISVTTLKNKKGYINQRGKIIVPFNYDVFVNHFKNGRRQVRVKINNDQLYGLVDTNANELIPPKFYRIEEFDNGYYAGAYAMGKNQYGQKVRYDYVLIDHAGNEISTRKYEEIKESKEGTFRVKSANKWGFIDSLSNNIFPVKLEEAGNFSEGLAAVKLDGKWLYIDKLGNRPIHEKYDAAAEFRDGFAKVGLKTFVNGNPRPIIKFGLINKKGEEVIPIQYDKLPEYGYNNTGTYFSEEATMIVQLNRKYGMIDSKNKVIIPFEYVSLWKAGNQLYGASKESGQVGIIDQKGNVVVPFVYYQIGGAGHRQTFTNEMILVKKSKIENGVPFETCGFIDKTGKEVVSIQYKEIKSFNKNGHAMTILPHVDNPHRSGLVGLIDKKRNEILPPIYSSIGEVVDGMILIAVKQKDGKKMKYGFATKEGDVTISPQFEHATNFHRGYATVKINGKKGLINKQGEVVIPCQYNSIDYLKTDNLFKISRDNKKGVVGINKQIIIPMEYDKVFEVDNGLFKVETEGKIMGYYDLEGNAYF